MTSVTASDSKASTRPAVARAERVGSSLGLPRLRELFRRAYDRIGPQRSQVPDDVRMC